MASKKQPRQKKARGSIPIPTRTPAVGRGGAAAVRRYLAGWTAASPGGTQVITQRIDKRLAAIDGSIGAAGPLNRLHLAQERIDREGELPASGESGMDMEALEAEFVHAAAA